MVIGTRCDRLDVRIGGVRGGEIGLGRHGTARRRGRPCHDEFLLVELVFLESEEDAEGEFELVDLKAGEEGVEDALLDQKSHGFGDISAFIFGLAVEDVGELVHEFGVAGEPGLLLVETTESGGIGLKSQATFFAGKSHEFDDAVVFVVLAQVEDEALVGGRERGEFADFFHSC